MRIKLKKWMTENTKSISNINFRTDDDLMRDGKPDEARKTPERSQLSGVSFYVHEPTAHNITFSYYYITCCSICQLLKYAKDLTLYRA